LETEPTSNLEHIVQPNFRTLFEACPGLYLALTPDLHIIAVTDAYLGATMTTRSAIVGRYLFDVFPDNPEDTAATGVGNLRASLERVLAMRRPDVMAIQKYDIRRPDVDGGGFEVRYWSPINSPVLAPDDTLLYIIHRVEDVTEFVRLKQQEHNREDVADALRQRTQQVEAEIYLRGQELLAVNQQLRTSNDLLNQLYRRIEELTDPTVSGSAGAGADRPLGELQLDSVSPDEILSRVGKLVRARADLEEQLRQSQKMEAVGRLAGGVAHDFNNLLTVILGYSSLIQESNSSAPECVAEIEKAASRAAALTKQLLAFSRKQVLQQRVLNPNEVLRGMESMVKRLIGEDIELELDLDAALSNIKADRSQVEQVILNLAVNARDAMEFGGTIRMTSRNTEVKPDDRNGATLRPGSYVRIDVADTGSGMDSETQARIFEPFFTTKEEGKGTGLGLATVYGIVKQSGGAVSVSSSLGKGTAFSIFLPPTQEVEDGANSATSTLRSGAGVVLLVEDEASLLKLIGGTLKRAGYKVVEAASGKDALRLCEEIPRVDLLVTDVVMPGMTGPQLVERLQSSGKVGTVLFMSGYAQELIGKKASDIKFLPKPFTPSALLAKVQEVLGSAGNRGRQLGLDSAAQEQNRPRG
jgi:signal transduction histidine kinase